MVPNLSIVACLFVQAVLLRFGLVIPLLRVTSQEWTQASPLRCLEVETLGAFYMMHLPDDLFVDFAKLFANLPCKKPSPLSF